MSRRPIAPINRMMLVALGALACATVPGCMARPPADESPALVRLEAVSTAMGYRLTLLPAPGARINARLPPVLELDGGGRLQFEQSRVTPDSSYFDAPPEAMLSRGRDHLKGVLRIGVCPAGLKLCRALALPIDTVLGGGN